MHVTRCLFLGMLLCACAALPDVIPDEAQEELALPLPEERAPRGPRPAFAQSIESFRLANGMTVVLLEDHAVPRVVVDTWLAVGTRDEGTLGRGVARRIERILSRPARDERGAVLVEIIERGGGVSHVGAGQDRTRIFGSGPAELLPALLARDAARLHATRGEPLDPGIRDTEEELPRDEVELQLAAALYPPGHPYHPAPASVEAGVGADCDELCAPADVTLVVAGDFDPPVARALIERTFGALADRPPRERPDPPPVVLPRAHDLRLAAGPSARSRLVLAWHAPAALAPGDAELELLAAILAEGPASRLERRLVLERSLAQEVDASRRAAELGSVFRIDVVAEPDADLDELEREIVAALAELAEDGPEPAELGRARERQEARFRRRMESLLARAEAVQAYRRAFGIADGFARDLARRTGATSADVRDAARLLLGRARVELRVLPAPEPAAVDLGRTHRPATGPVRGSS